VDSRSAQQFSTQCAGPGEGTLGSGPGPVRRTESEKRFSIIRKRPGPLAGSGPNSGVGARHALFPIRTTLGASLSRAVCFPTLLIAASDALGLIAGPSRSFQHRNFSSEASAPGSASSADESLAGRVLARLQQAFRTSTWTWGRPRLLAGRWPRVTGLTSYLSGCFRFAVG
jgi:hypothetical protein